MDSLKSLLASYESWVAANPDTVSDVETTSKWVSYFIAGRISDSNIVSELIYSLSNMLVFYNDRIIERARRQTKVLDLKGGHTKTPAPDDTVCYRLKVMLTTLEYSEVFIEISAKRVFGTRGKWLFVVLLQVAKSIGRFYILRHSIEQIVTTPAMPSLNRRALAIDKTALATNGKSRHNGHANGIEEFPSFTFHLRRSGRLMRKVEGAPPLQYRYFNLQKEQHDHHWAQTQRPNVSAALLGAEYLYIAKPLLHLASMGLFGRKRWPQFAVVLAIDLFSIGLYRKHRHLMNKQQKLEMSRRCVNLLLYLMRSPFYERCTQSRLERMLDFVVDHVPLAKMVAGPLRDYIPHWQDTYFYLWST